MSDRLRTGAAYLAGRRKAYAATQVTYCRGDDSVAVYATVERTEWDIQRSDGSVLQSRSRDYLIAAADLVLDSELVKPQPGDTIQEIIGEETVVFTVTPMGDEQAARHSDPYGLTWRIHTKRTGVVA